MTKSWRGLPIVILGIGGFAKEVRWLIHDINLASNTPVFDLIGYISHSDEDIGIDIEGVKVVASNNNFKGFSEQFGVLGVTIALGNPKWKEAIETEILEGCANLVYPNLIHPKANILASNLNDFGVGSIICAGVSITTNVKFGRFVIANINCTIGHDTVIGDYCTINPLAAVSGNINIEKLSLIGAGASIIEKTTISENSIVGLGAIIVKDIEKNSVMICKAAHKLEKKLEN
ncbi:hypothetical protein [Aneurinibacillus uraniidurans]|uniref:hypothetical protein n=1 Tax=Aneurinibacillus uraniidurans TaxID=2966586 RepID=UPI00234969A7|nr:hypothetical protein [Aneurinibacillus sp. B1]WCN38155.1 hypothetical protein PO771_01630 [Aneurinibacillus sp. B1]